MKTVTLELTPWARATITAAHGRVDVPALRKTLKVKPRMNFTITEATIPGLPEPAGLVVTIPDLLALLDEEVEATINDGQRKVGIVLATPGKVVVR